MGGAVVVEGMAVGGDGQGVVNLRDGVLEGGAAALGVGDGDIINGVGQVLNAVGAWGCHRM